MNKKKMFAEFARPKYEALSDKQKRLHKQLLDQYGEAPATSADMYFSLLQSGRPNRLCQMAAAPLDDTELADLGASIYALGYTQEFEAPHWKAAIGVDFLISLRLNPEENSEYYVNAGRGWFLYPRYGMLRLCDDTDPTNRCHFPIALATPLRLAEVKVLTANAREESQTAVGVASRVSAALTLTDLEKEWLSVYQRYAT